MIISYKLLFNHLFQEGGGSPSTLQMVMVPKVNSNVCSDAYSPLYKISPRMLCAGAPEGGKDACQVTYGHG